MTISRMVPLALAVAFATGCGAGVKYAADYDPTADYSHISTYQWAHRTPKGDDDPRVYNDITARRVKHSVNLALQDKGMREVTSNPDVYLAWHGAINGKMSLQTINSNYGYGYGWNGGGFGAGTSTTYVNEWDKGTLLIDVIDAKKNELIWRGSAQAELRKHQDPSEGQEVLNDVVARILRDFPPGSGE